MGFVRNLEAAEIVSQVATLRKEFGWSFRNIVFMGMGEPLDNFDNVAKAMRIFHDQRGLGLAWERITLCTSGSISGLKRLKTLGLKRLGLSISLNAGRDEVRDAIMPVNRACGLAQLAATLAEYPQRGNFVLGVNYCLLPGINDSEADAKAAGLFCARVGRCLLNLIPYNPGFAPITTCPTEEEIARFAGLLEAEGILVKRRREKGRSIMAGCGQLGLRTGIRP
jgi:23S rRNA (adenine2503-C2)-methyltransferase